MSDIEKLKVDVGDRSYDILIGSGLLENAGEYLIKLLPAQKVFIVTDDNVAELYLKTLQESLDKAGISVNFHVMPYGEQSKSFDNLEILLDKIFAANPDRKTTLIALGGGVVGDLTGFAASIILRGINFVQIPATLLAQVDSSVGGKTGINTPYGKNMVGSFYQPSLVLIDTATLTTLPIRQFWAGYAEVVKYAFINDLEFFRWLENNIEKILNQDNHALQYIIKKCCSSKSQIVAADEREGGSRALLNFGHTFGHALEKATGYSDKLLHGEAVAIGMVFAFKLSHKMGLCDLDEVKKAALHLKKTGLPTSPLEVQNTYDIEELMVSMRQDKKASGGKLTFILANKIGDCFIENNVSENKVRELIEEVLVRE